MNNISNKSYQEDNIHEELNDNVDILDSRAEKHFQNSRIIKKKKSFKANSNKEVINKFSDNQTKFDTTKNTRQQLKYQSTSLIYNPQPKDYNDYGTPGLSNLNNNIPSFGPEYFQKLIEKKLIQKEKENTEREKWERKRDQFTGRKERKAQLIQKSNINKVNTLNLELEEKKIDVDESLDLGNQPTETRTEKANYEKYHISTKEDILRVNIAIAGKDTSTTAFPKFYFDSVEIKKYNDILDLKKESNYEQIKQLMENNAKNKSNKVNNGCYLFSSFLFRLHQYI